ncbi:MAG: right-handed parallel beta-helix repeat-containing protein, partial [Acidobacteriota bacterium]|nr:right-handed parallel beta-helix repeat-containing protein [Acidobacteriota bacterium]
MTRARVARVAAGVLAAALVALAAQLPLWSMTMRAPQYPRGLPLYAYGTALSGDVHEINILNHYIGMPPIEAPALETALFPFAIAALVVICLLSPLHQWLRRLAIAATAAAPVMMLVDLQWRLYSFGHSLDPKAPIRLEPFTPLVVGETTMGNFVSTGMVSWGFGCIVAAALVLVVGARLGDRWARPAAPVRLAPAIAALFVLVFAVPVARAADVPAHVLQARIDAAPPGSTLIVPAAVYRGPIVVRGPLSLIGEPGATIDGGGRGSVVTISGSDVVFRGFTIRNSGRAVTEEAAGLKVTGNGHRIESNEVVDVYFGIHIGDGARVVIDGNRIRPGKHYGARPGHAINAWRLRDSRISGNWVADARDGIYLSFTERVTVTRNVVTDCRYGLHSMYSHDARFENNEVTRNLLGAALMMSDRLVLKGNRIRHHREGVAAYGILLKDIGDLVAEDNEITSNRIGIYAESVPSDPRREAVFSGNVIAGNEVGLALQSTARLTLTGNRIAENLSDVRALGRTLA